MSQIARLWSVLSPAEQQQFLGWMDVFYARQKKVARKLAAFYQSRPEADEAACFAYLFPGQPYTQAALQRIRHVQEELSLLVREFLALLHFRRQEEQQTLAWLTELKQRQALDAFDWFFGKAWKKRDAPRLREQGYYSYRIALGFLAQEIGTERGLGESVLPELLELHSQQLAFQYGIWQIYLQNLRRKRGTTLLYPIAGAFEQWVKAQHATAHDSLLQFVREVWAFVEGEQSHVSALVAWFEQNGRLLSAENCQTLYTALLNGMNQAYSRRKDVQMGRYLFQLYRQGLDAGWLTPGGTLPPALLRNFVYLSTRTGLADEAAACLPAYGKLLHKDLREPSLAYCRALLLRYGGQHQQAIEAIQKLNFADPIERAHHILLLIWLYYDRSRTKGELKGDQNWLRTEASRLKREVKTAKGISSDQRTLFRLHLDGYLKLISASQPSHWEALKQWVAAQPKLPYGPWFEEALRRGSA